MKEKLLKLLKSRQFWTLMVMFVVNGFEGVKDQLPATILPVLNSVLTLLAVYFRIEPKQNFPQ